MEIRVIVVTKTRKKYHQDLPLQSENQNHQQRKMKNQSLKVEAFLQNEVNWTSSLIE